MPHIIHISTVHGPKDNRIYRKECLSLHSDRFEVSLIGNENKGNHPEDINFISLKRRGRLGRMFINTFRAFRIVLKLKPDLIHIHDPELIPSGLMLRLLRYHVVYDMHEDLPAQIYDKNWIPELLHDTVAKFAAIGERFLLQFFSGVVTVTEPLGKRIRNKNICVLKNYPRKAEFEDLVSDKEQNRTGHQLLYIGTIAFFRGLREMVEITIDLSRTYDIKLVLCGETTSFEEKKYLNAIQNPSVQFKGWLDREQLRDLYRTSDIGLVLLYPTKSHELALPVKLFEYMGAGLPVLCSDFSNWSEIVRNNNCGLVTNPLDPVAIREKIIWMIENKEVSKQMGLNGKAAVMEKYLWENEVPKLVAFYNTILA